MSSKHRLLIATVLLIISLSMAFTAITCIKEQRALLRALDEKLHLAACLASESVPNDYHDRIVDKTSVSASDYARIVDQNDKLCREYGLQYLWSCMAIGDRIVFTTSTSPSKDVKKGDYAHFFALHHDPRAFANVFKTMKTDYSSFHNEWGEGRMVLIPAVDSNGRRYCFGASIGFDEVNSALRQTFESALALCGWILAAGIAGSIALATRLTRPITRLTKVANDIANGDMDQVIEAGGGLELQSLGESIAVMRDSVCKTISRLKLEIGERQRTEEALREAESRYRILFGQSPDGIVIINPKTAMFVDFNESARLLLDYSHAEFSRLTVFDIEAAETREEIRAKIAGVIENGRDDFETRLRTRNAEIRHVHVTAQFIEALQQPLYHCVWRDITKRKQAEAVLRESETRHQSLFENMLEGVAYCEMLFDDDQPRDFVYLAVNKSFERLTGLENAVGKTATSLIPGIRESNPELFEIYGRVSLTGQPQRFEQYLEPLDVWLTISVYRPKKGCFVAVFDNISERKIAAEALRASEERYRSVVDNIGIGIALISPQMEILQINPQLRQWNPDIDLSKRLTCYRTFNNPPRSEICSYCPTKKTLEDGLVHESITETPFGSEIRNFRVVSSPVKNDRGEVIAAIEMVEDMTEHKRLEREVLEISEFEKQRLGQDLHDDICQALIGTAMQTKVIANRLELASNSESESIKGISGLIEETAVNVRNLARTLFPSQLTADGFVVGLSDLASHVERSFRIPCSFECLTPPILNDENFAAQLFRIAQEALHNGAKHSQGTSLSLRVDSDATTVTLDITDDGIGHCDHSSGKQGMGMRTMQYRANQIGATLSIQGNHGRGTRVVCSAPLPDS